MKAALARGEVRPLPLSIVIATLGGEVLRRTVDVLNGGSRIPAEILICVPADLASRVPAMAYDNVRTLPTPMRGQVAQRAAGFREAREPLVMQLDDDMEVRQHDLEVLVEAAGRLGPGNAVAPVFLDETSGECIHRQYGGTKGFLQNLNAAMAGASWGARRMGRVSSAGTNFGVDRALMSSDLYEADWLPGGCVVHHRQGLVTDNFYPFAGKAFCEDLMHSHLLRSRGVRLWVVRDAVCRTSDPVIVTDLRSIRADVRARRHYNAMRRGGGIRFWLWLVVSLTRRSLAALARRLS